MTAPLTRSESQLNSRFRLLEQKLNDELAFRDRRLRFSKRSDRSGATTWLLNNNIRTEGQKTALPRVACELAVSQEGDATIHVAYNEQWVSAGRRAGLRFQSSNLRFLVTTKTPNQLPLQFRLEWAGRIEDDSGKLSFPGLGAAHPHWQFDVDAGWEGYQNNAEIVIDLLTTAQESEAMDLEEEAVIPLAEKVGPSAFSWFHRLHLPARAMWHDAVCLMPNEAQSQQHEPTTVDEIDRWILSALRYVRHEFVIYV